MRTYWFAIRTCGFVLLHTCCFVDSVNPFRTAAPFWGQTTQISSRLSPKRDCGSKGVNGFVVCTSPSMFYSSTGSIGPPKRNTYVCVYKALRSTGGLRRPPRSVRKEKHIKLLCEGVRSPWLNLQFFNMIVVANWRLDNNAKMSVPPPCFFRRKQLGRHITYIYVRFASRAVAARTYIPEVGCLFCSLDMFYVR